MRYQSKGFTLIELLAVISILAILMLLAAGSVTGIIGGASKKAFVIDAEGIVENAQLAYTNEVLSGNQVGNHFCMSLEWLKKHYMDKVSASYKGSVEIQISGNKATYKLWLSNGKYRFGDGATGAAYPDLGDPTEDATDASVNCGGTCSTGCTLLNS